MTNASEALGALGSALGIDALPTMRDDGTIPQYLMVATGGDRGLLVPGANHKAAASAILRVSNGQSATGRLGRGLLWAGSRMGALRWLKGGRFWLVGPDGKRPALLDHIAETLDIPDLLFAFSLGPQRPNRKPVLQLVEPSGQTVAFAKIGWNELTTRLVTQEAQYLRTMPREQGSRVAAPELLHHGSWGDLTLTVLSAMNPGIHAFLRSPTPGIDLLLEIASLGDNRARGPFATSGIARSILQRGRAMGSESGEIALEAIERLVRSHGDAELELGDWHGDFGPWNMAAAGAGRFNVWDWERATGPQVVGMDLFHYHFQQENFRGARLEACIDRAYQRTATAMAEIQGADYPHEMTGWIYLLERLLRYREPGAPSEVSPLEAAITSRLSSMG